MSQSPCSPRGMAMMEWVISFPAFVLLSLGVIQVLLLAFHSLMLSYSAQEVARMVSLQGVDSLHQERAASQVLGWMWTRSKNSPQQSQTLLAAVLHPSPDYVQARAKRTVQVTLLSPTLKDLKGWTSTNDHRFLPPSPGEPSTHLSHGDGRSLREVSTVRVELVSVVELSVPLIGRIIGQTIAAAQGCQSALSLSEDCLFLQGRHPLNMGKPMLAIRRVGRSLLQPAIDLSRSSSLG